MSLTTAAEVIKRNNKDVTEKGIMFKIGDKVLLDGKNLKMTRPKAKLSDKQHKPFEITDVLGSVTYCLKLLPKWHIHPVFHTFLLAPYIETPAHNPNFLGVPPNLLDADEKYDVEEILNSWLTCNKWGVEYLMKWLDYSSFENMWELVLRLTKVLDKIADFHKAHPKVYKKPLSCLQGLNISIRDIWAGTSALRRKCSLKRGYYHKLPLFCCSHLGPPHHCINTTLFH